MKLNFKDLKQQRFTIDAEPSDTIAQVKEKIASEKGWDVASQKLIYSGKILADSNTVESYKIEEKGFIVCMVSKPKAAPAAKAAAPPPSTPAVSASTPAQPPAPQPNPVTAPTPAEPPATPTPAAPPAQTQTTGAAEPVGFNDPSAMLVGNRNEATITQMEAMGFARPEIERALRAAFFNPDRAIEYLLNGIPEHIQAQQQQQQAMPRAAAGTGAGAQAPTSPSVTTGSAPAQPTGAEEVNLFEAAAQAGQGQGRGAGARGGPGAGVGAGPGAGAAAAGAGAGAGGDGRVNIDFLRNSPQFQQLRQLVQQQPAMLEPILQQLAEGNPALAQMIAANQEQFLQLLAEDVGGGEGGEALPPGVTPIAVTEEERDAIERLCRLGFSRDQVIQAYFACDKNEELAANFLFEQPDDDEQ